MSIVIYIILFKDKVLNKEIQDLEKYYRLNGAIYICKTEKLIENKSFFLKDNIFAYIMDRKSSVDIDEEIDFKMAEVLMEEYKNKILWCLKEFKRRKCNLWN